VLNKRLNKTNVYPRRRARIVVRSPFAPTGEEITMVHIHERTERWHRYWDKKSRSYDREMRFMERMLFGDSRQWACSQASGDVLEVAVGTGLNLDTYPPDVRLTGLDLSEQMLDIARTRAAELGRNVELRQGNAQSLPFGDATFDTVVCTFGLCAIPDMDAALDEMTRVLKPAGRLILVDHVASSSRVARGIQRALEIITVPMASEHFLRRPRAKIERRSFTIERVERFKLGLVERLVAQKNR
jgi:ubiquinone/menaquinone biosynthesis C-methylase UbiE